MTAAALPQTFAWHSAALARIKRVNALVPPTAPPGAPLPTLYLLHGYGGNRDTWTRHTDLHRLVAGLGMVVVMPESGRHWLINDASDHRYEEYLVDEVIPFAERTLGSAAHRDARAIAGFSMGGATALMHALRRPDLFRTAASLSGAVEAPSRAGDPYADLRNQPGMLMPVAAQHERTWGPEGSATRRSHDLFGLIGAEPQPPVSLYLDVGSDDHPRVLAGNRRLHDELVRLTIDHVYRERPGGHSWEYIRAALPEMLTFVAAQMGALELGAVR